MQPNLYVDVTVRYRNILKIFWSLAIIDWGRCTIMIVAIVTQNTMLANLYQGLFLNDLLGIGALVVLHIFRFQLSGRICAGDYIN
jgi:hypothetical protein